MERILSEKELVASGSCWGQWTFSLSDEQINEKISSISDSSINKTGSSEQWERLFSILQNKIKVQNPSCNKMISNEDFQMECLPSTSVIENKDKLEESILDNSSIEDMSVCLVDLCNQVAPKLRLGLTEVQEEMRSVTNDLNNLSEQSVTLVMVNAWSQLQSDASKLCFCVPFTLSSRTCERLCKNILLPWLSKSPPSKMELLSSILSLEGETVCQHLVAPLLQTEESPLVQDLQTLEELMTSLTAKHWTTLLKELLLGLEELQKWIVPVLSTVVEHAEPSCDNLNVLAHLMSAADTSLAQSRDFGMLLVASASCLKAVSGTNVLQLKLIANNYKGPLKYKALKILDEVKE